MIANPPSLKIALPLERMAEFCRRWAIRRLEIFGSALRDDFRPDSDVDLVATYAPEARWSLLDRVRMKQVHDTARLVQQALALPRIVSVNVSIGHIVG